MPDGPDPDDMPIDPDDLEAVRAILDPLQATTGIGQSLGTALEDAPYPPVRLLGNVMQLNSQMLNTAFTAGEAVPNALQVYADAQERGIEAFAPPPPKEVATDLRKQIDAIQAAREQLARE